jgi:uncharacterized protein YgiM (DUF1202 family)
MTSKVWLKRARGKRLSTTDIACHRAQANFVITSKACNNCNVFLKLYGSEARSSRHEHRHEEFEMKHLANTPGLIFLLTAALMLSACIPVMEIPAAPAAATPATGNEASTNETAMAEGSAIATVATRSLRVRSAPSETAEVIAGIAEGERYPVLGISSDGLWVQLAIDEAPGGSGWVSSSFVTVEGPITNAATVEAPSQPVTSTAGVTITGSPATASITTTVVSTITPILVPTPAPGFAVVRTDGTRLRVRAEPSVDSPIVGYVYNGESYAVLNTSVDGLWVEIGPSDGTNPDNTTGGWVAAEFLLIGQ